MDDVVAGFDGGRDDVTVIVFNRTGGGPWRLVDQQGTAGRDTAIEDLARRLTADHPPRRPPVNPAWPQLVADWLAEYTGPTAKPFALSEWQLRVATGRFARLVHEGKLTTAPPAGTAREERQA